MFLKRMKQASIGAVIGGALLVTTFILPQKPVEAMDGGTAAAIGVFSGVAGLMVGSAMERNAQCHRRHKVMAARQHAWNQRLLMRNVLAEYRPECHNYFVEYVLIDLQGHLSPRQQQQLIYAMEQRRSSSVCYCY